MKLPLNSLAEDVIWSEVSDITKNILFTSMNQLSLVHINELLQRWQTSKVCCVIAIAQNVAKSKQFVLVLLPDKGPKGNLSCSYQLVSLEGLLKTALQNELLTDVVGTCENVTLVDEDEQKLGTAIVYPFHEVIFLQYPTETETGSPSLQWDELMNKTKTADFRGNNVVVR